MKVSREGVILIKSFEGFRPHAVRDEAGRWTIGYGHTLSAREGLSVNESDAELLLQYDLLPVVQSLNASLASPVNQHQFDALASFAFSVGLDRFQGSDVLARLNAGAAGEAADALIGWPDATPPQAAIRRRAAERALFVADPAMAVTLADLLAAPLPPPAPPEAELAQPVAPVYETGAEPSPAETSVDTSEESAPDARAAALATLLGEPVVPPTSDVIVPSFAAAPPVPAPEPEPETEPVVAEELVPETTASPVEVAEPVPEDAVATIDAAVEAHADDISTSAEEVPVAPAEAAPLPPPAYTPSFQFQRYTPYAAPMFGPLPNLSAASAAATAPRETGSLTSGEAPVPPIAGQEVAPEPEAPEDAHNAPETASATGPTIEPRAEADAEAILSEPESRSSVSVEDVVEPIALEPMAVEPLVVEPLVVQVPEVSSAIFPVETPVLTPTPESSFVLTPSFEDEPLQMQRPVWDSAQRSAPAAVDQEVLFEEEPALASVLRHEESDAPRRFDWSETGAFLIMGGVGLASCAASAAAFRLAAEQPSPMGETTVIAWVLALIGIVCVGASSWNLYLRWTGPKGE
jgi:GH24 family phage-related lysozyme (muramidase)